MNRTNNNNILVPTDFSEVANNALGHALKIADVYKNEITLINIQDEGGIFGLFGSHDKMELVREAVNTRMDALIAESKKSFPNVKINKRIEIGKIDFLKDTVLIKMHFYEDEQPGQMDDSFTGIN